MALPEQVRRRAERANELIAQISGDQPENPPAGPTDPPQVPPAPPAEPPAPTPAPAPAEPPAPAAPAPAPADDDPNSETWKHKYLTLQGVLNTQSRTWAQERQGMEQRIAALEAAAKAPPPAPTPATPQAPAADFTQEELDRFGPELLNLIAGKAAAMAEKIVTAKVAELQPTLEQTRQEVHQVRQRVYESKEQEFWGELTKAVPDHQLVNADPRWLAWLGEEDDMAGVPRQVLLDRHAQNMDHVRVAKMFKAFKKAAGIEVPASAPAPNADAPAPAMPTISPSPRSVGSATAPTPREPQVPSVKRSDIAAHYRRSSTDPTYRASQEYRDMEQRIAQATAANQVVAG